MDTSGQSTAKVIVVALGPLIGNYVEPLTTLVNWALNEGVPPLIQTPDKVVLLSIWKRPDLLRVSVGLEDGTPVKKMEPWNKVRNKMREAHIHNETVRIERTLEQFWELCTAKVDNVIIKVKQSERDVHLEIAEVADSLRATHLVMGTDDARTRALGFSKMWKSKRDRVPAHIPNLGSKVAALAHCNISCISLTTGQLVHEFTGKAPLEESLPRLFNSGPSSGPALDRRYLPLQNGGGFSSARTNGYGPSGPVNGEANHGGVVHDMGKAGERGERDRFRTVHADMTLLREPAASPWQDAVEKTPLARDFFLS